MPHTNTETVKVTYGFLQDLIGQIKTYAVAKETGKSLISSTDLEKLGNLKLTDAIDLTFNASAANGQYFALGSGGTGANNLAANQIIVALNSLYGQIKTDLGNVNVSAAYNGTLTKSNGAYAGSGNAPIASVVATALNDMLTFIGTSIDNAISRTYKACGSKAASELTSSLLVEANEGNVYNLSTALTVTASNKALFTENVEGSYPAGTNFVVIKVADSYLFDVLAGFVDLSGYVQTSDLTEITAQELADMFTAASA